VQHASRTLAFESRLLLLGVFKVDVLEILHGLAFYSMIGRPETSNIHKINQTEQQTDDYQQSDAMDRYVLSLRNFWRKNQ
jgi:hypothetical protein